MVLSLDRLVSGSRAEARLEDGFETLGLYERPEPIAAMAPQPWPVVDRPVRRRRCLPYEYDSLGHTWKRDQTCRWCGIDVATRDHIRANRPEPFYCADVRTWRQIVYGKVR